MHLNYLGPGSKAQNTSCFSVSLIPHGTHCPWWLATVANGLILVELGGRQHSLFIGMPDNILCPQFPGLCWERERSDSQCGQMEEKGDRLIQMADAVHPVLSQHCPAVGLPWMAQMVKRLPTMLETRVQSLGWEDLLVKEMATHCSILAWKIL